MSEHTPGPFFTTCPHGGTIYVEARLRGSTIQEVAAIGPTETPEQQEANARLFSAAPELLEALILLATDYHNKGGLGFDLHAATKMFAAINKAKGLA